MKAGLYWYRGFFQTSWNEKDPWTECDWMVVMISVTGSLFVMGTEVAWRDAAVARMEREGEFVEITQPVRTGAES